MASSASSLSPVLLAVNQRLLQLREQLYANKNDGHPNTSDDDSLPWHDSVDDKKTEKAVHPITGLPPHLGWVSETFTQTLRRSQKWQEREGAKKKPFIAKKLVKQTNNHQPTRLQSSQTPKNTVKHYPSIGIAALKAEQAPIYRIWLMCRYLDMNGRGWLPVQDVRKHLTGKESKLRLFCWRRLRQILGQGHEQFWKWDKASNQLWLFGAARVAAYLDVERLSGKPVALPIKTITAGIGDFKAHLYGAWHSGRKTNNPISREVQEAITSLPERTQRHYCKVAGIRRQANIAIGNKKHPEEVEKQAWQRGRATFEFVDHQGRQGRKGTTYIAWHLPNSYTGPHQQTPKGRMRKINRKLRVLVTKGARGNSGGNVDKLYYANGGEAGRAFNRNANKDAYWSLHISGQRRQADLWSVFFVE